MGSSKLAILDQKKPVSDHNSERGVHNPDVIDLVSFDKGCNQVRLSMLQTKPWEHNDQSAIMLQLMQLEEKFNRYLGYILDGFLLQDYPKYEGKKVAIEIQCVNEPSGQIGEILKAMQGFCEKNELGFVVSFPS